MRTPYTAAGTARPTLPSTLIARVMATALLCTPISMEQAIDCGLSSLSRRGAKYPIVRLATQKTSAAGPTSRR